MPEHIYFSLAREQDSDWHCSSCTLPAFSDSFFNASGTSCNVNSGEHDNDQESDEEEEVILYDELRQARKKNPRNFICGQLNINSFRNKFWETIDIVNLMDMLSISETKLDSSFTDARFNIPGYIMHRRDRNGHGGGIITYIKQSIPHRRLVELESESLESIVLELLFNSDKWIFITAYRPLNMDTDIFQSELEEICDKAYIRSEYLTVLGDLNYNLLKPMSDGRPLIELCDSYDLINMVDKPTCHKSETATLLDVILTSSPDHFKCTVTMDTGLSDFHHMTFSIKKGILNKQEPRSTIYRSYKHFDVDSFNRDINCIPFHITDIFDDVNDKYWAFSYMYLEILEEHAPFKTAKTKNKGVPMMNSTWRKAIFKKRQLRNKWLRSNKNPHFFPPYRKQRNYCTYLKRAAIRNYFDEKCKSGPSHKDFWPTIKPFLDRKNKSFTPNIMLAENDKIVTDQAEVCELFNGH